MKIDTRDNTSAKDLIIFIEEKTAKYKTSSHRGIIYLLNVLKIIKFNFEIWKKLTMGHSIFNDYESLYAEYYKHIKRTSLCDIWNVSEIRIRELAEEGDWPIKSQSQKAIECIEHARERTKQNEKIDYHLRKAIKELKGDEFIQFPRVLSVVLKHKGLFKNNNKAYWDEFFSELQFLRNTMHNNFTCLKGKKIRLIGNCRIYSKGDIVNIDLKMLICILENLFIFFSEDLDDKSDS